MEDIYVIEVYGRYFDEENNYTLDECFSSYQFAREHLLKHFDSIEGNGCEYFKLKENHQHIADFDINDTAEIKKIKLIK